MSAKTVFLSQMVNKGIWLILILLLGVNFIVIACSSKNSEPQYSQTTTPKPTTPKPTIYKPTKSTPIVRDLSGFNNFVYYRDVIDDSCVELPQIDRAYIEQSKNDEYLFYGTMIFEGIPGIDTCEDELISYTDIPCVYRKEIPERTLTTIEVQELIDIFQNITIRKPNLDIVCEPPCDWEYFEWDGMSLSADVCASRGLVWVKRIQIVYMLNKLAEASIEGIEITKP